MAIFDTFKPSSIRYISRVTALVAKVQNKAKLALPPPDALLRTILRFATALEKLKDFAVLEQRSVSELAAEVELTSTWTRLCEDIAQQARDFHSIDNYIEARQEESMHVWVWQRKRAKEVRKVEEAQRRIIRDTNDVEELLAQAQAHKYAE